MGKAEAWRWATSAAVVVAATGAIGWRLWPEPPPPPPEAGPKARLQVAGEEVDVAGDPVADALDRVRRYVQAPLTVKMPSGETRALVPAKLGVVIDRARLGELVNQAMDDKTPLAKAHHRARQDDPNVSLRLPVPVEIDGDLALAAIIAIKDDVDEVAVDAAVDLESKELKKERMGFRMDAYATLARVQAALRRGAVEVEAVGETIRPRVLASQLGDVKFDQVLGYFETRYSRSSRHKARTYNLRLAASRLDGTVLLPGEVFDFNGVVGPRDEANGYRVAPVIAQGELVDGIGGGTCQISGTLHGAVFFAGLEIVSRAPHTRPSSYIKLGMDAAVAYPTINFKVRNDFAFPVVLHETVKGGVVRAEVLGPKRSVTTTFFRRIDEILPFEEELRETDDLAKGERVLTQRGVPGFRATVFRIVRDGAYAVRTKRRDVYPPTTQIVRLGTGSDDAKGKYKKDNHPEYRADEYLVVTQGPQIRSPGKTEREPGGGMIESRVQGRTGKSGWQEKEGMPVFRDEDDES